MEALFQGIRAGRHTANYVKKTVDQTDGTGGAAYLSLICILPAILIQSF